MIQDRKILNFASNDYLGLASDPKVKRKIAEHFLATGPSASSSRLVSANFRRTIEAEKAYADYFGYESALFFPSGYQANFGILSTLIAPEDLIFYDKHVHASTIEGIHHSRASFYGYNHNSYHHLQRRLEKHEGDKRVVLTESLFSMDGDLLDVRRLKQLKDIHRFLTVVDEAHTFGVMGERGKGISRTVADIAVGTFGKAFGLFGAFVLMPALIREYLINFCSPLVYTTALPEAHSAMALDLLEIADNSEEKRHRIRHVSDYMRDYLMREGFSVSGDAHILTITVGDEKNASLISKKLLKDGIFVFAARYPTVPKKRAILRIAATALHEESDIWYLVETLKRYNEFKMHHRDF